MTNASTRSLSGNNNGHLPEETRLQGGSFVIKNVLGQGGFGITYLGGDLKLRRYVAIKEFFPANSSRHGNLVVADATSPQFENAKKRFIDEARALARFRHPNIAQVLTIFEENNTAYMVMEFLDGKTFQQIIDERGVLSEQQAVNYIKYIGEALIAVHEAGLIHRDIKDAEDTDVAMFAPPISSSSSDADIGVAVTNTKTGETLENEGANFNGLQQFVPELHVSRSRRRRC